MKISHRTARLAAFVGGSALTLALVFGPLTGVVGGKTDLGRVGELTALNLKFDGAGACASNKCHGAPAITTGPGQPSNENLVWSEKDPHSRAHETLAKNAESKKIGAAMSIADVTKSEACLACHSTFVPDNLRGKEFKLAEGNTCTACHGPSEKWLEPHAAANWTNNLRKQMDHAALLKTHGLYDTKPPVARAEICVGCHLAIDPVMIKAGHPQPSFELDFYSTFENFPPENPSFARHWRDPKDQPYFAANLWVAGQAASLKQSLKQLASRTAGDSKADDAAIKSAQQQAAAHALMAMHAAKAMGDSSLDGLAGKLAGDKAAANAAATAAIAQADTFLKKVSAAKPDADWTKKTIAGIAGDTSVVASSGKEGAKQQALALYSLYYNALAPATNVAQAQRDEVVGLIGALFPYFDPKAGAPDAAKYNADLATAAAKLK